MKEENEKKKKKKGELRSLHGGRDPYQSNESCRLLCPHTYYTP